MNRGTRALRAGVVASLMGCSAGTGTGTDAGTPSDAGFHYTIPSQGTATFSGDLTGTWGVSAIATIERSAPQPPGPCSLSWFALVLNDTNAQGSPHFACTVVNCSFPIIDGGVYTSSNSQVDCLVTDVEGGTEVDWGDAALPVAPPSTFELQLTSLGPLTYGDEVAYWNQPSATFTVYLAPNPPGTGQGVSFSGTVAPPACPMYCAPGP
jgi:hypothetical protein